MSKQYFVHVDSDIVVVGMKLGVILLISGLPQGIDIVREIDLIGPTGNVVRQFGR